MDYSNTIRKKLDQSIFDQLNRFPESPGVYIMKDEIDKVLYIGKVINLRKRPILFLILTKIEHIFQSCFKARPYRLIATNNETEALILEANL